MNLLGDGPCDPGRLAVSVLFLTGLHVFPTFVVYELTVLMVLTLSVVIMKVCILPLGDSGLVKFILFLAFHVTQHTLLPLGPNSLSLVMPTESVSLQQHLLHTTPISEVTPTSPATGHSLG